MNNLFCIRIFDVTNIFFFQKKISIKNFKIMLVNGLSRAKKETNSTLETEKESKVPASGNSVSNDNAEAFLTDTQSLANNDAIPCDGDQVGDSGSIDDEFNDRDSVDENSFELRVDNDEENENFGIKYSVSDLDIENQTSTNVERKNDAANQLTLTVADKVPGPSFISTDLENITIPDTINDDDDNNVELTAAASLTAPSETSSSPVIQSLETEFNCVFCEKKYTSKNSLKFHVLSHLKSFLKHSGKDDLDSTFESENVTEEDIGGNASWDSTCVLCDKSFANKMTLKMHYRVDHQAAAPKGSPQNQNRSFASAGHSLRRQSSEHKIDNAAGICQNISSTSGENCANLSTDENGCNEDASKQYKCYICDKQFARHSSLMWHIQFHETYMYSKLKKNNTELENGLSPGDGGAGTGVESFPIDADHPFRCQVCGKTYESLSGYRRHVVNHGAVDEEAGVGEKCELCNKFYPTAVGLKRHIIFMHKDQLRPPAEDMEDVEDGVDNISGSSVIGEYVCELCERPFTHRSSYKRHMKLIHKMSADEVSSLCQPSSGIKNESRGKLFSPSGNVQKHAREHCKKTTSNIVEEDDTSRDTAEEFNCDLCHRSFCSQRALSIHRAHGHRTELSDTVASDTAASDTTLTGDKIPCDSYIENEKGGFQCTVCDKIFESRKGVVRHIGYHRSALNTQISVNSTDADGASDDNNEDGDDDDDEDMDDDGDEDEETSVPCLVCGKTFQSIRGMRIHAYSHRDTALNDDDDDDDDASDTGFDCDICNETFKGYRSFKIHISWHRRRGDEAAPRKKSTKRTATFVTPPSGLGKIHQCQHCPRWYATQQALAGHMKVHQAEKGTPSRSEQPGPSGGKTSKTSMCKVCGQHFPSSSILSNHMKLHIEEGVATPTTSSGQPLTLADTMECDMCGKFFMRKQDMAKHMRDHMNGVITKENVDLSLFRCIYCSKSFVGRKSLNTHQVLHEEAKRALKRAADELLVGAPPEKQHRPNDVAAQEDLIGWDDAMQALQCEECDRRLSTKQSLRRHMEWHARVRAVDGSSGPSKEKNLTTQPPSLPPRQEPEGTLFECLYCKKSFRTKELLVEHTRIHEDVPAVRSANAVVNDLEALGEHAVVQSVEGGNEEYFVFEQREGEAYQCSECDETHVDKLQMIAHMAYHVGLRWAGGRQRALIVKLDPVMLAPFECLFCEERFVNKTFRTQHVLQRHAHHVFQCNLCNRVFLNKKKLALHCHQHLIDSMYRCKHCLKYFTSKWFLKRHTRRKCVGKSSPDRKQVICWY